MREQIVAFGEQVRKLRLNRGYTQDAVAEELGVSHATLSAWERGTRVPSLEAVFALADYYDVLPSELVDSTPEAAPAAAL